MNILSIILSLLLGFFISYFINYCCNIFPIIENDQPIKAFLSPVCTNCQQKKNWKTFLYFDDCIYCGAKISIRNKLVLIIFPILFTAALFFPPANFNPAFFVLLLPYFFIVAIIDFTHRIILRSLTLIGWVLTLIIGWNAHDLPLTLIGGVTGLVIMLMLYYAGVLFKNILEKRRGETIEEALGFGDVYISIMTGFLLAFPNVISGLLLSILLGGLTSLIYLIKMLIKKEYNPFTPIPYAPFMILATIIILYRPVY